MDQVPFFALHGIKVTAALIGLAAVIGVARYLGGPARAARRRRARIDLPGPTPLSALAIGDRVTLEGTLVADGALDLGGGDSAAVAAVALDPGRREESRRMAAAGALAIEVEGRRVAIDEACDVRGGKPRAISAARGCLPAQPGRRPAAPRSSAGFCQYSSMWGGC